MKAIVLHQPWAQFVALGWKRVETRSWATKYRGPIAICAAKTTAHIGEAVALAAVAGRPASALPADGAWPLGCVVAVANVVGCRVMPSRPRFDSHDGAWLFEGGLRIPHAERVLGDLTPGRFAWALEDVRALPAPVPVRGRQGLWTLDEKTARAVRATLETPTAGAARP